MTIYSRKEKSGKRPSVGWTALPDCVEATLGVMLYIANLATDANTKMGQEALERVENQWEKPFHSLKEGVYHFFVTNRRVVESEYLQDEFGTRFNVDLAELEKDVRRGNTWLTTEEAGPVPVPEFKATRAWLDVAPLYMKGRCEWRARAEIGGGRRVGRRQPARRRGAGAEGCSRRTQR